MESERNTALKNFLQEVYDEAQKSVKHVKAFNRLWLPMEDYGFQLKRSSSVKYHTLTPKDVSDSAWMVSQLVWKQSKPRDEWSSIEDGQLKVLWWSQKESRI